MALQVVTPQTKLVALVVLLQVVLVVRLLTTVLPTLVQVVVAGQEVPVPLTVVSEAQAVKEVAVAEQAAKKAPSLAPATPEAQEASVTRELILCDTGE
jgi:hypothetical protein